MLHLRYAILLRHYIINIHMRITSLLTRLTLAGLILSAFAACSQAQKESQTTNKLEADSVITCVSHGIPSRAAAIGESQKEHAFLGADDAIMVYIKGGSFLMGTSGFADASPVHEVTVEGFWMDEHEVTNAQFERFVA